MEGWITHKNLTASWGADGVWLLLGEGEQNSLMVWPLVDQPNSRSDPTPHAVGQHNWTRWILKEMKNTEGRWAGN